MTHVLQSLVVLNEKLAFFKKELANKRDITCLSETCLDRTTQLDDNSLEIPGYNLASSDHSSNYKTEGACICYKTSLPFTITDICLSQECICFKVKIS